jgi:hypothetical protein
MLCPLVMARASWNEERFWWYINLVEIRIPKKFSVCLTGLGQHHHSVLAVDDRHVAFGEYNGSVARIICVAVATLANEKLLERASDNDLLLCRSQLRIKRVIDKAST